MYEHHPEAMGFSELPWYEKIREGLLCEIFAPDDKPREFCFRPTSEEEAIAHNVGCTRHMEKNWGGEDTQRSCDDDTLLWCCPENQPRDYMRNIPPEVAVREEERQRWLDQEPATTPDDPDEQGPNIVSPHTTWTRLTRPGALAAIGLIAVIGYLGHRTLVAKKDRGAADV